MDAEQKRIVKRSVYYHDLVNHLTNYANEYRHVIHEDGKRFFPDDATELVKRYAQNYGKEIMWMIMAEANRRTKNKDYQKSMLD